MKKALNHTLPSRYRCEYHTVFTPKYHMKVIHKQVQPLLAAAWNRDAIVVMIIIG